VFSLGFWEKPFHYWFGFGDAISTLARQRGNPSKISIGARQEGGGSIHGLHWSLHLGVFLTVGGISWYAGGLWYFLDEVELR
jgi:hypothetical protein